MDGPFRGRPPPGRHGLAGPARGPRTSSPAPCSRSAWKWCALLLAWAWAWLALSRGRVRRAALVFIIGTWIIATYAAFTADGVRAPAYLIYLLLVVYAAFLVTPAAALGVFLFSLMAGLVMTLGAYYHFLPLPAVIHTPATLYASYSFGMLMIVLIVLVITREYRDTFGRLRGSEEWFRLLFEEARDPILVFEAGGRCLACNQAAVTAFGAISSEEVVGKTHAELSAEPEAGPRARRPKPTRQSFSRACAEGRVAVRLGVLGARAQRLRSSSADLSLSRVRPSRSACWWRTCGTSPRRSGRGRAGPAHRPGRFHLRHCGAPDQSGGQPCGPGNREIAAGGGGVRGGRPAMSSNSTIVRAS